MSTSQSALIALGGDHAWHDADRRTTSTTIEQCAANAAALPPAPAGPFTGLQLEGGECVNCRTDNGPDVEMRDHSITLDGDVLRACYPACPPPAELLPAGLARAEAAIRYALTDAPDRHARRRIATQLVIAVVEETELAESSPGRNTWPAAHRASSPFYLIACDLTGETIRRHVEGAQMDGISAADAAKEMRRGLLAACNLYTAEHTDPELFGES
ncbi:hypothetical protein [Kitasatospora sp. NPDC057198]|uniref:hypothetical protein n=1 Tax=Kitasatospora sp. NPDC057198 TaxID=3346046 RepID=UPI00363DB98C